MSRISEWVEAALASIKTTYKMPIDLAADEFTKYITVGNLMPGRLASVDIGEWNMAAQGGTGFDGTGSCKSGFYKEIIGIPTGFIPLYVEMWNDSHTIESTNNVPDRFVMADFVAPMAIRPADNNAAQTVRDNAIYYGKPPIINVYAQKVTMGETDTIRLRHDCPSKMGNTVQDLTIAVNMYQYIGNDSTLTWGGNNICNFSALRVGDEIVDIAGTYFRRGTKILEIRIYENQTTTTIQIVLSKPLVQNIDYPFEYLTVRRNNYDYESVINIVSEISGGIPTDGRGYFLPHSASVLADYSNTAVNRGKVHGYIPWQEA